MLPWVLLLSTAAVSLQGQGDAVPPILVSRTSAPIVIDGDLSDAGWRDAAAVDTFYETAFADNRAPLVQTIAYLTYDDQYIYAGFRCLDPTPHRIRAPFVERDDVSGSDDNVALFLSTRRDGRIAQEFRVSPRGIQTDAVYNDDTGTEDFAPDFFYDTAARIGRDGWTAEMRIPLSSLRYEPSVASQAWRLLLWRNYPRDFRYGLYSSPLPADASCLICHAREISGIAVVPAPSHIVVAPSVNAQVAAAAPTPGEPLSPRATSGHAGGDIKWNPTAYAALDLTVRPDFSQIEADPAQITVNNRFALFVPEKRPFFLEGLDLFDMPIRAFHSRTISDPRWGARVTGTLGHFTLAALLTEDAGGGTVIVPGPLSSEFEPQQFHSLVGVARVRREFKGAFAGFLYTGREVDGGGYNRVLGPDFAWRPGPHDQLTGQVLFSRTRTRSPHAVATERDDHPLVSRALQFNWFHSTNSIDWTVRFDDFGDGFRADDGFVTQVGYRKAEATTSWKLYPRGVLTALTPFLAANYLIDGEGRLLSRHASPGISFRGRMNAQGQVGLNLDRVRTVHRDFPANRLSYSLSIDPGARLPRIGVDGTWGGDVDLANERSGRGGSVSAFVLMRPTARITAQVDTSVQWLNIDTEQGGRQRLFTAQAQTVTVQAHFSPRSSLRLSARSLATDREPSLYVAPQPRRFQSFLASALFTYRVNWQTAFFLGYGDDRSFDNAEILKPTSRQAFAKVSYALRR